MERIQPKSKSKEQYTREFVVSANEVQKTIGPPSYAGTVQPIREAVITNLIGMSDRRDPQWGMLWMILNTANAALFPGGPQAQIQPTAHPGDIIPWVQPTTQRDRENYMIGHVRDMERYENELAINEAMKDFILTRVDPVYFDALRRPRIGFKGVTLLQFLAHLATSYPATPEEKAEGRAKLSAPWDPTDHIATLFERIKKTLESLADMYNMATYLPSEFIEATYMAIQRTGEFNRDCEKWKRLPVASRTTEAQIRAFFLEKYEMWDVNKSLQDVGIAAQAERMAVLEQQNRDLQAKFVAHSAQAQVYHGFIDHAMSDMTENNGSAGGGAGGGDDQTMVSQLTHAMSAQTDAMMQAFQTALAANQSAQNSGGGSRNGGGGRSTGGRGRGGRGGRHTAGGRGQGGPRRPASDGPIGTVKTTKYWSKNDNCCWTCGYDISSLHDSTNCNCKLPGHITTHTGDNPAPGASTKDKEFSKWA